LNNFIQTSDTSYLLGPLIDHFVLNVNFSSLKMRDQASHPYKTTGRFIVHKF